MADKSEVLNLLRARGDDWTSPAQIRASIHVPDRTLRNWLRDLVEEGAIERRGERKGRRYRLVGRSVVIVPATGTCEATRNAMAPPKECPARIVRSGSSKPRAISSRTRFSLH